MKIKYAGSTNYYDLCCTFVSMFYRFQVVGRGSETQLRVGEKSNTNLIHVLCIFFT